MSTTSSTTSPWYDSPYPPAAGLPAVDDPAPADLPPRFAVLDRTDRSTPRWARPAFGVLLLGTALLYVVGLGASGNANSFYAAAVQAGTLSWKAFFFGSLDASNFITVDKPPMSLWPMEIAGRVFGFNTWSMLVPQALMGVASVALLTLTVRRWFGWTAGLVAGLTLALTPVAVLMFRFNNPDALMVLLLVVGAWALTHALESGRLRWMVVLGVSFGFGFLTKGLQPFTVIPAFAVAFLLFAPLGWGKRIVHLLVGVGAILVSAGWWVVAVLATPAADRPYIGGSTNNNPLELAFGYNGLGRLTGNEGGGPTGGGGGAGGGMSFSGSTGLGRLFNSEMGGQISWLLPAALVATVALLAVGIVARRSGTDTRRLLAATVVWGGWLLVTGAVLSFASGTIHAYYTVQLAPAIAALVGIGLVVAWRLRHEVGARVVLAAAAAVTGVWAFVLLGRSADYWPGLRYVVLLLGLAAAVAALAGPVLGSAFRRPVAVVAAVAIALTGLAAPAAYAATTASTAQQGSMPSAGPAVSGGFGGFGARSGARGGTAPSGGFPGGGTGGFPGGGTGGFPGAPGSQSGSASGDGTGGAGTSPGGGDGAPSTGTAPTGGRGAEASVSSALVKLVQGATDSRWAAATIGSQTAAALELASGGVPVMAIGGFTGSDPAPTLAQFQAWVAAGDVHWFIGGGGMGRGGDSEISQWVEANFTATTVGNSTVYDLTQPAATS
ncbi:ArnT family glycosyltransferase [Jatrophihabitans sp. YIM 134969]